MVQVPAASKKASLLQRQLRLVMLPQLEDDAAVVAQVRAQAGGLAARPAGEAATKPAASATATTFLKATIFENLLFVKKKRGKEVGRS